MSKSIEAMWKQGFVDEGELSVPKVNDLYNQKSQNIVDKLQAMFALNIKAIIIGCGVMFIVMTMIGAPLLGGYICLLVSPLIYIAKRELSKSYDLSKGQSSLDYLQNFDLWLKSSIAAYGAYYRVAYPLLYLGMVTQAIMSQAGHKVLALCLTQLPTDYVLFDVPYYLWLVILLVFVVVVRYSEAIYRFDLNVVYGRQFKKLEEIIADMRELKGV
ncbi:hypothetical protein NI389_05380 [Pseudoalteromonas xiamenensis]|uniref:hypothetical protein n=1 Tax=Pseudoalteromonas xiamenensis TaxID=882626 RepID=UPI0027E3B652|nr:hypothetical protein [Pseudoalteromonas xiamenensis]WMN60738.1 hypothetical protein NI389_04835 [Pseudoalteromonas xiamenensis]WMN60843.1 hypothetical protein NI389_05380 [Pseudoalteromonas xiamenensis]